MTLLVDVGNTNITFTLIEEENINKVYRLNTEVDKTEDEYFIQISKLIDTSKITKMAIASVVPRITLKLESVALKYFDITPFVLESGVKTGVFIKTDNPKEVGADLICAAAALVENKKRYVVVDLGTATKYIYIEDNKILGVIITPGIKLSIQALVGNTALLPDIDIKTPKKVLGTNTIECMQSGVTYGTAVQVDGLLKLIKKETNQNFEVIFTGGLSNIIAPLSENKVELRPNLILEGLLKILKKN